MGNLTSTLERTLNGAADVHDVHDVHDGPEKDVLGAILKRLKQCYQFPSIEQCYQLANHFGTKETISEAMSNTTTSFYVMMALISFLLWSTYPGVGMKPLLSILFIYAGEVLLIITGQLFLACCARIIVAAIVFCPVRSEKPRPEHFTTTLELLELASIRRELEAMHDTLRDRPRI